MAEENKNLPVFKSKCGGVEASIWAMKTEKGTMYSVTTHRNYKDKEGNWQKTQSYNINDIASLKYLLDECFKYCKVTSKLKKED